jgi:hypothetical protein
MSGDPVVFNLQPKLTPETEPLPPLLLLNSSLFLA